jgi:hypothetical protein
MAGFIFVFIASLASTWPAGFFIGVYFKAEGEIAS